MTSPRARAGYTLIECLIAMTIGAILVSLAIATLQNALMLERAGQRHRQRHASLARLAEQFRADIWSATGVAEGAGQTPTLHLKRPDGETIAYTIGREGSAERTLLKNDVQRSRETYRLPEAAVLRFEITGGTPAARVSLLCADRKPPVSGENDTYKQPQRVIATLGRDRRYLAPESR